ncbi:MAG: hypothetical protein IJ637_09205 [Prevotella sp.]|nr:hypothetical protein [Prevotella sp.]
MCVKGTDMKAASYYIYKYVVVLAMACMLTACDKLDDGDDAVLGVLPGTWMFSYELQSDEDTGLVFYYDQVIFGDDGTCAITSPTSTMNGTYRASNAVIRIDGEAGGEQRTMLWRIISFSKKQVVAEYEFEYNEQSVTAIVTLERDLDADNE